MKRVRELRVNQDVGPHASEMPIWVIFRFPLSTMPSLVF